MTVTSTGATIQLDCAHGTITRPLAVDSGGHFDLTGTYTQEGGPTPASPTTVAARYTGLLQVSGQLGLSITLTASNQTISGFSLQRGVAAILVRCL